jgi:hypothetical protein
VEEEVVVGLVQLANVCVVQALGFRVRSGALAQSSPEDVGRCLEVDHEVRHWQVWREQLEESLIDEQLVVVQIQVRVDLVALEQVVADRELTEEVGLSQLRLLAMTRERVEELRLECGARATGLSVGQKRVVDLVEDDRRVEAGPEPVGQA